MQTPTDTTPTDNTNPLTPVSAPTDIPTQSTSPMSTPTVTPPLTPPSVPTADDPNPISDQPVDTEANIVEPVEPKDPNEVADEWASDNSELDYNDVEESADPAASAPVETPAPAAPVDLAKSDDAEPATDAAPAASAVPATPVTPVEPVAPVAPATMPTTAPAAPVADTTTATPSVAPTETPGE